MSVYHASVCFIFLNFSFFGFTDSRRLYYKKKQQKSELRDKINEIEAANEKIRKDNKMLERLLAEARALVDASSSSDLFSEPVDMADFELLSPAEMSAEAIP